MHLSASRPLVPVVCAPELVVTPMADFGGSACARLTWLWSSMVENRATSMVPEIVGSKVHVARFQGLQGKELYTTHTYSCKVGYTKQALTKRHGTLYISFSS